MSTPKNPQTATTLEDKARLLKAKDQPLGKPGGGDENAPVGWDVAKDGKATVPDVPLPAGSGHAAAAPALSSGWAAAPETGAAHGVGTSPAPSGAVGGGGGGAGMQSAGPLGGAAIVMPTVENRAFSPSTAAGAAVPQVPRGGAGIGDSAGPGFGNIASDIAEPVTPVLQSPQQPPVTQPPVHAGIQQPPLPQPALIAGTDTGTVTEDASVTAGKITTSGTLTVTDPDVGQDHFTAQANVVGTYGSFTLASDGTWTYSADNGKPEIQQLKAGDTLTDSFTVTSADGTTHTVKVTIQGSNDAPSLLVRSHAVAEDGAQVTGKVLASDVDSGDTHTFSIAHPVAGFTLNADGSYSFDPRDAAYQHLAAGQRLNVAIDITVTDGSGASDTQPLFITVTGTNDGAAVSGVDSGAVGEDATLTTGGKLDVTDIDDNQAIFTTQNNVAGTYGSFSIGTDGTWTYQLDNTKAEVQALKAGETRTENFVVTSADGTTHTVAVTVTGANDAPGVGSTHASNRLIHEDSTTTTVTGHVQSRDADAGDTLTWSVSGQGQGTYGHLDFDPASGTWTYRIDNADADTNALAAGQRGEDVFQITATDGSGASASTVVRILVLGENDAAVIAGATTGTVSEDTAVQSGHLQAAGQLTITDPDAGEAVFQAQANTAGQYGVFTLAADGSWTYSADNGKPEIQQLKAGATLTDSFTVTSADGTTHTVTVTIQGSNDAPTLQAQTQSVSEDGAQLSGQMVATDVDTGDSLSFSAQNPPAGFTLNSDGSYSFDPANAAYQHLAAGQTQTLTIPVTVTDSAGASATQNLVITLTGTNDGAVVSGVDSGAVGEDATLTTGGKLDVTDIDDNQAIFTTQNNVAGTYGSFSIGTDGTWTYALDNTKPDVQALKAGETRTENFVVTSADGTTHTVAVTVTGANDAPLLQAQSQSVTEDSAQLTGHLVATDVDAGDTQAFSIAHPVAGFTLNADGSYSFDPSDAAYQHLAAGQTQDVIIPVMVTDSAGATSTQNLTITVTGTNDTPAVSGALVDVVTEDGSVIQTHNLPVMDFSKNLDGAVMTMGALATGDMTELSAEFSVISDGRAINSDHHGATFLSYASSVHNNDFYVWRPDNLTICIGNEEHPTGINIDDGGSHRVSVVWSSATGSLDVLVDGVVRHHADGYQQGYTITGGGTLVLGQDQDNYAPQNGSTPWDTWSFDKSDAFAGKLFNVALSNHAVGVQALTHTPLDQLLHQDPSLVVNIQAGSNGQILDSTGHNQLMVYPGTTIQTVAVDSGLSGNQGVQSADGQLQALDVDDGQSGFQPVSLMTGTYGSFTMDAAGHWHYQLDNASPQTQALLEGQQVVDRFTVLTTDGTPVTVAITVIGRNDVAVVSGVDSGQVTEDANIDAQGRLTATGDLQVVDVDAGQAAFQAAILTGNAGVLSLDAAGHWEYHVDNSLPAVQKLGDAQVLNEHFTVSTVDGTQYTITVTIHGKDDGAVIAGTDTGTVTEDASVTAGKISTSGQLTVTDPDAGQDHFTAQANVAGTYGSFTLDAQGHWAYSADNSNPAIQQLKAGATLTDSFTITSADGTTHTVTVTIQGSNDTPNLLVRSHAVAEDGAQVTGKVLASDVDAGDTHTFSLAHPVAGFTLNADGSYSFDPSDAAYQHLAQGQRLNLGIDITVTDSAGASNTQPLFISITGTNDGAVISGTDTGAVKEDIGVGSAGRIIIHGKLDVADIDTGEAAFTYHGPFRGALQGQYGALGIGTDGAWEYHANNAALQSLREGQQVTDTITVTSKDGTTHNIVITITGANDGAVITGTDHGDVIEDTNLLGGSGPDAAKMYARGQLSVSDVDAGEAVFVPGTYAGSLGLGEFRLAADGQWRYLADPAQATVQALKPGQTLVETAVIRSADGTTHTLTVTIHGTADAAIIGGSDHGSVTEDGRLTTSGRLTVTDPDSGEAAFQAQSNTAGAHGSFTLAADGSWTYQLNNADPAVQALNAGQSLTDRLTVRSVDGTTHDLSIVINGTDDGAHLIAQSRSVSEDGSSLSGHLQLSGGAGTSGYTFSVAHPIPGLQVDPDGSYFFSTAYPDYQHLRDGQQLLKDIPITVTDSQGHTVTEVGLRLTIIGANDGAKITGDDYETLTEDRNVQSGQLQASGHLRIDDIDLGQEHFLVQQGLHGQYGTLDIDAHGQWHYTADNSQSAIQNLNSGQSLTDRITVQSVDGTRHDIVITVQGADEPVPPPLQGPALIQAPPTNHVLQPHLVQSGDIYQQLIDTFLATHNPVYVAAAHAMQAGNSYSLYGIDLQIDGAGILITDPQGNVSTSIHPNAGSASIDLGSLVDMHNMNPGNMWVQAFNPQSGSNEIRPWLHKAGDTGVLSVHFHGEGGTLLHPGDQVSHSVSVPFFAPPGGSSPSPAPAPAPDAGLVQQHDDPSPLLDDHSVVVIQPDHPTASGHAADGTAQADHVPAPANPVDDYLQFATTSQHAASDSMAPAGSTLIDHYLAAAGVDAAVVTPHAPDLPPTEVLLEVHHAADAGALPDQAAVDDAAQAAALAAAHDQPLDDPQHHGV